MRNQLNCTELCLNRASAGVAALIPLPEQPSRQVAAARTPAQELRAARLQGIQVGASEQAVWLWLAGSALVTLALSFLG